MHRRVIWIVSFVCLWILLTGRAMGRDKKAGSEETKSRDVGRGVNFYSIEKEIALGQQMAKEVEFQSRAIDDPVIAEFVNRIGQNLLKNSDARVPLTVKLLDSEDVNAFALPGGFLFVNSGLVLRTNTEAELAGVMAHEIAHVSARHWTKQATRSEMINIASIPLIFVGGVPGYATREGLSLAMPLGLLEFTRIYEREADSLGLLYLYRTGYDAVSFIDFFERIRSTEGKESGLLPRFLGTHPMTASRIKAAQRQIESFVPKPEYVISTSEFDDIHARLSRLHNRQRLDVGGDSTLPRLAHRPGKNTRDSAAGNTDPGGPPTLKRGTPAN